MGVISSFRSDYDTVLGVGQLRNLERDRREGLGTIEVNDQLRPGHREIWRFRFVPSARLTRDTSRGAEPCLRCLCGTDSLRSRFISPSPREINRRRSSRCGGCNDFELSLDRTFKVMHARA